MNHSFPESTPDSADHWLAYRYLTGELSDEDAALCEAQLAGDLPLQLALAECVRLTSGLTRVADSPVVASFSHKSAGSPAAPRRSAAWTTAAAGLLAAGLLLTTFSLLPESMSHSIVDDGDTAVLDAASVVAMWSELSDEGNSPSQRGHAAEKFDAFGGEELELEVPDWMLVAVLDESSEDDSADPPQEQQL